MLQETKQLKVFKLTNLNLAYSLHGMKYGINAMKNADDFSKVFKSLSGRAKGTKNANRLAMDVVWSYTKYPDGTGLIYVTDDLLSWLMFSVNIKLTIN